MNQQALDDFRNRDGWAVGGDATVAVVKVGANGNIDSSTATAPVQAFVLTNAGLMAGVSLEGSTLRPDNDANALVYGSDMPAREIVKGSMAVPSAARGMIDVLNQHSPKNLSGNK